MKIDLHIHSSASDGSYSPAEIVKLVKKNKLAAFSITDHDTIDGNRKILENIYPGQPSFITGVEISSSPPESYTTTGNFHILGYGFDLNNINLGTALDKFQIARKERNPKIIDRLNSLGMEITMKEAENEAGDGLVGRPHMARILSKKGYVSSIKEAFDKYLAKGRPAFVDKYRIDSKNAIRLILEAGGIPVLAHPVSLKMSPQQTDNLVKDLSGYGLMGIEAYYTDHSPDETRFYYELARKYRLLITGGSDFHGSLKDNVLIGSGKGDLNVPYTIFEQLVQALEQREQMTDLKPHSKLEKTLNYQFTDKFILDLALRHSSYVNEQQGTTLEDNERLEFLGDAVLNLVIGDILMKKFPDMREGDLSRMRSGLVNETQLAGIARNINLGPSIKLGRGEEQTNGREKNSILSDVFEAVIAAVYNDGGFDAVFCVIETLFESSIDSPDNPTLNLDHKSRLQELSQTRFKVMPRYKVVHESGPDHDKTFKVRLKIDEITVHGTGKSKKSAEQDAAGKALIELADDYHL